MNSFMAENITLLSLHGIHVRDQRFEILNRMLDKLQKLKAPNGATLGEKGLHRKGATLDFSNSALHRYASGGYLFKATLRFIRLWQQNNPKKHWSQLASSTSEWTKNPVWKGHNVAPTIMCKVMHDALEDAWEDFLHMHTKWQWRASNYAPIWFAPAWRKIKPSKWRIREENWSFENFDKHLAAEHRKFLEQHQLDPQNMADAQLLQQAGYPHHPLFVAVDGGQEKDKHLSNKAAAAMVLFESPLHHDQAWDTQEACPLLIEIIPLPQQLGANQVSSTTAEAMGLTTVLETLNPTYPKIIINDSLVARSSLMDIRDGKLRTDRAQIRKNASGISKADSA